MRTRILIVALALIATACASGAAQTTTTSTTTPTTAPTTTTLPAEPVLYTYSYAAGDSHTYDIDLDQHITMDTTVEGDLGLLGTQDSPSSVDVRTNIAGSLTYDISEGPEPDTTALHITGVFDELAVEGTIDGVPASSHDLDDGTVPNLIDARHDHHPRPVRPSRHGQRRAAPRRHAVLRRPVHDDRQSHLGCARQAVRPGVPGPPPRPR
ncbi:MAG: hypothetical protein GXP34_13130 [Actinobacteria bacterium]|nr:hypothetical protein [Actinomycetota bacterium]